MMIKATQKKTLRPLPLGGLVVSNITKYQFSPVDEVNKIKKEFKKLLKLAEPLIESPCIPPNN